MIYNRLTDRARKVLKYASESAFNLGHEYASTEHILLGICREGGGIAANVLKRMKFKLDGIIEMLTQELKNSDDENQERRHYRSLDSTKPTSPERITLSPRGKSVMHEASGEMVRMDHMHLGTEHILVGLMLETHGIAFEFLKGLGITVDRVRDEIKAILCYAENSTMIDPIIVDRTPGVTIGVDPGAGSNSMVVTKLERLKVGDPAVEASLQRAVEMAEKIKESSIFLPHQPEPIPPQVIGVMFDRDPQSKIDAQAICDQLKKECPWVYPILVPDGCRLSQPGESQRPLSDFGVDKATLRDMAKLDPVLLRLWHEIRINPTIAFGVKRAMLDLCVKVAEEKLPKPTKPDEPIDDCDGPTIVS